MCGIMGYVGSEPAVDIVLAGLKRLEYRGYDSAGLGIVDDGRLAICKTPGRVKALADDVAKCWAPELRQRALAGIGHTRWATHGAPTRENAHPHLDAKGRLCLVHNGIIENFQALRARLEQEGHSFLSQTDTEVLAHLIGEFYEGDLLRAVCAALKHVEGAFGIAVLAAGKPDEIVVARRGSPIVLGLCETGALVASDAAAIMSLTRNLVYLEDHDVAVVHPGGIDVRSVDNVPVSRPVTVADWDTTAAEKGGYAHFMLKEIFEQPEALTNTLRGRLDPREGTAVLGGLDMTPREINEISRLVLLACGTSLHACQVAAYAFEELADLPVCVEQAAEFRYRNPIVRSTDLVVAVSQSGETADTLAAVREAQRKGARVASICNVVGSSIARESGRGVYLHAGPEIGVASTKAFTCQVLALSMMALKFGRCRRLTREQGLACCQAYEALPGVVRQVLEQHEAVRAIAGEIARANHVFYIGRGTLHPAAMEGALKLKEISYIHAEGYQAAELKHGPIALLQPDVPVVALANDPRSLDKTLGNMQECRARQAPVYAVVAAGETAANAVATRVLEVPRQPPLLASIPAAIVVQLLAYYAALARGCEIDQPRNLAKSVTVE
ncbi:MAG: glutamine--fructose-6-phosphate transaminase (isomerizing) [Kiritimatiellae bacterium]|nr:glutamine--fructose-6-phosphate transaminase (isomerizing) [Kiritimatiellia bacterium]